MVLFQSFPQISLWNLQLRNSFLLCLVAQSCLTLADLMDCSPPGSSVHGILQARILEWVAMPSSRGSSQPRDQTQVSHIAGGFFTVWATRTPSESMTNAHSYLTVSIENDITGKYRQWSIITKRKNLQNNHLLIKIGN